MPFYSGTFTLGFFFLSLGLLHVDKRDTRRAPCPNPCPKVSQPRIHPDHLELLCRKFSPLIRTFVSHVFKILTHKIPSPRSLTTYLHSNLKVGLSLSVAVILWLLSQFFLKLLQCARSCEVCSLSVRSLSCWEINVKKWADSTRVFI